MTQDPEGPFAWLSNFGLMIILAPMAAASHAYAWGQRDQMNALNSPKVGEDHQ